MKILIVSHLYPNNGNTINGSFVHSQVKALQKAGCKVEVVSPTPWAPFPLPLLNAKWKKYHYVPDKDIINDVPVIYPRIIRTPRAFLYQYAGYSYIHSLQKVIPENRLKEYNLVHAQVGYPDGWAVIRIAKKVGVPVVLTFHGQELLKTIKKSKKLYKMIRESISKAGAVIVPSEKMFNLAKNIPETRNKLYLIYNGVDQLSVDRSLPGWIADKIKNKKVILSVSSLIEQKGIQNNLFAVARLVKDIPNIIYIIVGDGPYKKYLVDLSVTLGLENNVIFTGTVNHEYLGAYYKTADVFSMPSREESFGVVYLEAMKFGLPIIGTEGEGISTIINKNNVGYTVPYGNVDLLVNALVKILSNPKKSCEMGSEGVYVSKNYSWERNAYLTLNVYRSVISNQEER